MTPERLTGGDDRWGKGHERGDNRRGEIAGEGRQQEREKNMRRRQQEGTDDRLVLSARGGASFRMLCCGAFKVQVPSTYLPREEATLKELGSLRGEPNSFRVPV